MFIGQTIWQDNAILRSRESWSNCGDSNQALQTVYIAKSIQGRVILLGFATSAGRPFKV